MNKNIFHKIIIVNILFFSAVLGMSEEFTHSLDTIIAQVKVLVDNNGKESYAVTTRTKARKEINNALAILKKDKRITTEINAISTNIRRLSNASRDQQDTSSFEDTINKHIATIKTVLEQPQSPSFLEKIKQKAYGTPFFAGWHSTPEEKQEAQRKIKELETKKAELFHELIANKTLNIGDKRVIRKEIKDIKAAIEEQKIITGQEWTKARKAAWAGSALGAAALTGLTYKRWLDQQAALQNIPPAPPAPPAGGPPPSPPLQPAVGPPPPPPPPPAPLFGGPPPPVLPELSVLQKDQKIQALEQQIATEHILSNKIQILKRQNDEIWIRTSDGKDIKVDSWKINEMLLLKEIIDECISSGKTKCTVSVEKGISFAELQLLNLVFDAVASGHYNLAPATGVGVRFIANIAQIAEKVNATGMNSLCSSLYFPKELHSRLTESMLTPVMTQILQESFKVADFVHREDVYGWHGVMVFDENKLIYIDNRYGFIKDFDKTISIKKIPIKSSDVIFVSLNCNGEYAVFSNKNFNTGNNSIYVENIDTQKILYQYQPDSPGRINKAEINCDGKQIAIDCYDLQDKKYYLKLIDIENQKEKDIKISYGQLNLIKFNPKEKNILMICLEEKEDYYIQRLIMFNIESEKEIFHNQYNFKYAECEEEGKVCYVHDNEIDLIQFSPNGKKIAVFFEGSEPKLLLLDAKTGKKIWQKSKEDIPVQRSKNKRYKRYISAMAFSLDNKYLMCSLGRELLLLDVETGVEVAHFPHQFRAIIASMAFNKKGNKIALADIKGNVFVYTFVSDLIKILEKDLSIVQVRFLYECYLALQQGSGLVIEADSINYRVYSGLPFEVQQCLKDTFKIQIQ